MNSLAELEENDDLLEIQQLETHFSSKAHIEKRKAFWDSFFTKFSTNIDEDDAPTDEVNADMKNNVTFEDDAPTDKFVNADMKNNVKCSHLRKSVKSKSSSSTKYSVTTNLADRKSKRNMLKEKLRSYILKDNLITDNVINETALLRKTQKDNLTNAKYHKTDLVEYKSKIKQHKSRCKEQNENVCTNSQDFDKLRIKYIIEEKLCSDLNVKIFKRFYFRKQQDEEFKYWENLVKEEIHKLLQVLSMKEIVLYMKTSLLESVSNMS